MAPAGQQANQQAGGCGPLPAGLVVGAAPVLKEPILQGGRLFWLEQLPAERGRTTLRMRSRTGTERELTAELDLRSHIHGYGGGVYCVAGGVERDVAGGSSAGSKADCTAASGAHAAGSTDVPGTEVHAADAERATASGGGPGDTGAAPRLMGDWERDDRPPGEGPQADAPLDRWPADQTVVVVAEGGRSLWRLDLPCDRPGELEPALPAAPVRITPAEEELEGSQEPGLLADGLIDLERQRWIGVCEQEGRDRLVTVPLAGGAPQLLWNSPDFCGYAALSPEGSHLAWVSWQQPCMPWERSQLWLGRFSADGKLVDVRPIAGSAPGDGPAISVFQPLWAGADLVVACDRSGWWNLECLDSATDLAAEAAPHWRALLPMQAECGMPQWVYGMRTCAWDGRQLLAAACESGRWALGALVPDPVGAGAERPEAFGVTWSDAPPIGSGSQENTAASMATSAAPGAGRADQPAVESGADGHTEAAPPLGRAGVPRGPLCWQPLPLPFDDLAALDAEDGRLVAIASGPVAGPGLLELDACSGSWSHHLAADPVLAPGAISIPEPLWFAGHGERPTHAWYYPPRGGSHAGSPLLVRGHSGPTAMARTGLSLGIQYWTSRGWGVVDVNYGGSTGFGRAYRERLDGGWGVVDVDDCLAAARSLVAAGRADPARIAMEGSSASGFTVLAALARGDTIKAGAIRYPVTDLTALAESDHRFEARYFDALVGPWPAARPLYEERSPLRQGEHIQAPLLFFHGLDDRVVPAEQSISMVERLRERGVSVELHLFEGEGHGFRDAAVQRRVLERTEAFFREQFHLPEPA